MKSIELLRIEVNIIKSLADKAASLVRELNSRVEAIESDKTRTQVWKTPQVAELRSVAMSIFTPLWEELRARYDELYSSKPFWDVPLAVLGVYGIQGMKVGSPEEATCRSQILVELKMLPKEMLRIRADAAVMARDWAGLYLICLVLMEQGCSLPTNLSQLPIGLLEQADEIFYEADLAKRTAEIDLLAVRGQRSNTKAIALGLLQQQQDELRRIRAASLILNWDERQERGKPEPQDPNDKQIPLDVRVTV